MTEDEISLQLKLLSTRKEYIFREIQILYDLSKDISVDKTKISAFKSRYKRIESVRSEYIEVANEVNALKLKINPKVAIDFQSVEAFDTLYYTVQAAAEQILAPPTTAPMTGELPPVDTSVGDYRKPSAQARLPKIELPKFDGNIELWQTFYDTFLSLVHDNNNLTPIEKFHYLLSCLSGSALSVAKGVPVTANNYSVVFDTLVNRFQNKRILATNYLDKIITYPSMKACNLNELRNMTSILYETVNALKAIKIEDLGEFVLFYLASRNLDSDTRKRFESQNKEPIPTFDKLLIFLQDYVKVLEASESCVSSHLINQQRAQSRPQNYRNVDMRNKPNNNQQYRSTSLPVNSGMYSETGPHSDLVPYFESVAYTHEGSDPNTGPYSNTGLYFDSGPYLDSVPHANTGPYVDSGPYSDAGMHSDPTEERTTGTYSAAVSYNNSNKFPDCACCGFSHHGIYKCPLFHAYNVTSRQNIVKTKKLCTNCLRPNHNADKCFSKSNCTKCNSRHHTLLHEPVNVIVPASNSNIESEQSALTTHPVVTMNSTSTSAHVENTRALVLLGTCTVCVRGPGGNINIRALIDSGAQDCFMTTACAQRLGLPLRRCHIAVAGLGQNTVHQIKGVTSCSIQPRDSDNPRFDICPIVMDTITNQMPTVEVPSTVREACKHLIFADDDFDKPNNIELLLGAELFHNLYDGRRLDLGPGLPAALHSVFGWVITGKLDPNCRPPPTTTSLLVSTLGLDKVIKRFWEVEEPPSVNITNPEDEKCEQLFSSLVKRNPTGRYVVPILLKEPCSDLGESYNFSLARLFNLEKRLVRQAKLKEDYVNFMREYSSLGHMKLVDKPRNDVNIIPHHCVLKPDSATTKLRVVYDGSAKTSNGTALNDIVYTGPKLQNDIVDIITKFRIPDVVFTADISKMYRNIDLRPEDRKYQHILWRDSPEDPVREFELTTVTYGVSSSPYLAIRTLHQLAEDHGAQWPQAAAILRQDTFMDDITAGAPSVDEAIKIKNDLVKLLDCGKFELRKWSSNSSDFIAELPAEHCQVPKSFCDENNQHTLKILGIQWDPVQDLFTYSISELDTKCTKRAILSNIARIYDPLGWLTPVVLIAKLIIQHLWRLQLNWDEAVPQEVMLQWHDFCTELQHLHEVRIPRQMVTSAATRFELVGFCDGSTKAYGCCIYLRSSGDGVASSHLLIAKSRVAPLKLLTVNRLELLAAALLARVLKHMVQLLHLQICIARITAFTDSSTVLAWLNTPPYKLKTFVSHRVAKIIDEVSVENWQHVPTHDNPADLCSRGLSCSQLIPSRTWWFGPRWLSADPATWPIQKESLRLDIIPELKPKANVSLPTLNAEESNVITRLLDKHSYLSRVQRVLAWCLRFVNNSRVPGKSVTSGLTTEELDTALLKLVKYEQTVSFPNEIVLVKRQETCRRAIQRLNPYIDETGLLRVGGRLKNSHLPPMAINPLLLSKGSRLSLLLIDYFHRLYLHCGPRTLQSLLQRKFWILGIRNLIRSRLSKCITCFKVNPKPCQPLMGNLPAPRVQPSRCFQNIGVDFAGPFNIKESRRRNAPIYKGYVCVMVCLAVKAIHLEVVTDLSTPAFIAALDRFVSRRGLCKQIISDCGTNFVGARRYLSEVQQFLLNRQSEIDMNLSNRGISWHLNPPTGSHFGGIFESGVKSMKHHLKRVVGLQVLTYEELTTVLTKIEAVLNSRPLCVISADPGEVDVLTPGHFLTGGPLVSLPEPQLQDVYLPPRERWQMLQKLTQGFWRVWQLDYLHTLQQRAKWSQGQANLQIGNVVLIMDQNLPPLEWRLGKVTALHPGMDGVVRVVTLRTEKGLFRRPVAKLCPLPLTN